MSDNGRKILNIIIAVLVSIGAWTYVVYNNDPTTEVRYKDIPIVFEGEDALANNGLGVSQASVKSVDVTLRQKRVDTSHISSEDISVIADVSAAEEGENGISLKISGPDGTQVSSADKRSISVEVEEADTVEKKVYVEYEGGIPGAEPVVSSLTSSQATVIGAKSEIERVDRVAALLSHDDTTGRSKKFTTDLSALDEDGSVIEHLVIYPKEVNFIAFTGETKEVPLKVITEDPEKEKEKDQTDEEQAEAEEETGDGYERTYTAPDTIVIKGSPEVLEAVTEISTELIDIDSMYEDQEIEMTYVLPEGVHLANESLGLTINIKVTRMP